jgi:choline dehydrogenase-like flavoprotein/predicted acylesterase/phospholipase RssA
MNTPERALPVDDAAIDDLLRSASQADTSPFDFIIVGSGAGGGPLACRLAEAGKRVLLLEAGGDPKVAGPVYDAPLFQAAATEHEELSWQYSVRHYEDDQRQRADHKYEPRRDPSHNAFDETLPCSAPRGSGKGGIFYPRSSGIGGCTGHHAMIVVRPNDSDWESIADLTNDESWRARNMQPYFAKFEQCIYIDEYPGAIAKLLGWIYKPIVALMRFLNPRAVLDEGGHGRSGWQPTNFISLKLVKRIFTDDGLVARILVRSAFKVIRDSSTLKAILSRFLITLGFVRAIDPNDLRTREQTRRGGVFLIPTGIGGDAAKDENDKSLKGRRGGLREYIMKTRRDRPEHLVLARGVHVTKVLFDDAAKPPRAIGVDGVRGKHLYRASPRHQSAAGETVRYFVRSGGEVILCGGAFNTPQLLMLSGIGDEQELRRFGIAKRVHLPGVGRNLQDRYEVGVVSKLRSDLKSLATLSFDPDDPNDRLLAEWRTKFEGLYTSNGGTIAILKRSRGFDLPHPDLFTFGAPAAFRGYYWNWSKELLRATKGGAEDMRRLWTWVILKAYTHNDGGTVRLRSSDPFDTPEICFHSFDETPDSRWQQDLRALVEAVESMRAINRDVGSPFECELQPEAYLAQVNAQRREAGLGDWNLEDWIKNEAWGHHACGTCRIGSDVWMPDAEDLTDKGAVLDSHFRVHGVAGLRIVDASVFPKIPGYFILAPIFMVSEKAADTILRESADEDYPPQVRRCEEAGIRVRRAAARVDARNAPVPAHGLPAALANGHPDAPDAAVDEPLENVVGLALSGGGVRSATFSLGVLQAIAAKGRLRHVDYLATVSGGGFTGGFLGRLFTRGLAAVSDPAGRVQDVLKQDRSWPLRWLRVQANYLFASGRDDWFMLLGVAFRGLAAVHAIVGVLLFAFFGALAGIGRQFVEPRFGSAAGEVTWVELSPWWWVPVAILAGIVLPMSVGFWLAPKHGSYRAHPQQEFLAWLIMLTGAVIGLGLAGLGSWANGAIAVAGLGWLWQEVARSGLREQTVKQLGAEGDIMRNRLTRGLGESLAILLVSLVWVALDSAARTIAGAWFMPHATLTTVVAVVPVLQMLHSRLSSTVTAGGSIPTLTMLKLLGLAIALALLLAIDTAAHALFARADAYWSWSGVAIAALLSLALGRSYGLLNLSSLHSLYKARLTRTFLGASNEARTQTTDNAAADVQISHPGDDLPHERYRPEERGGPLHLMSVCINETIDHSSQREIRERKGLPMTVGSFGVSVGRQYFALWSHEDQAPRWLRLRRWADGIGNGTSPSLAAVRRNADPGTFHPLGRRDDRTAIVEGLTLGDWSAVSGGAFSTGRGRQTSPLLSLLLGLTNVRLGYWWDSGIRATERPGRFPANVWRRLKELPGQCFRTQFMLLSEWRARFVGPSHEFWNLTDGGHLDNSALYELIRRRVPFIICVDATRDLKYTFEDVANLVRLVRVDFGADVEWIANPAAAPLPPAVADWVNVASVGSLDELGGNPSGGGPGSKRGAFARIKYANGQAGWLLLIKAGLTADESLDVAQYARTHADFPQDSTLDQVFDDEQWESYRKLGHAAATTVLRPIASP